MIDLTRTPKRLSDMEKKKDIIGGSEAPVITDKKVTTTPPTTSIGATAPSQSEEEYNEQPQTQTPQTPPQTTINKDDLAAKQLTPTQATPPPTLPTQEVQKPPQPMPTPTDTSTPPTPEGEEGEFRSYRDILAKYAPLTSDEEKKKQMRRERRKAIVSALGDGLSALSNLYFTTKGAPDQGLKPGMTDSAKKRMDDLRAQWQKEKDKYQDLMLKGLEMDREQGNWLKSYKLQLNADKRADAEEERKAKTFEKELPLLEKKVQAAEEELKKLIRENNIGDATRQQSVEVKKQELAWKKYELEFMKSHKGYSPKEWEEHLATERYRSRTLANKSGKGGGDKGADDTYYIADIVNGKSFNASKDQVIKTYRWLQSRNFVSGKAKTPADMVSEIQSYYTGGPGGNLLGGGKKHYGRVDDKKGGSKTDALLGGSSSGITGLYDNF